MLRMHDAAKPLASIPPLVLDIALATSVTWLAVAASVRTHALPGSRNIDGIAVTLIVAMGAVLVLRRRFPLAVLGACAALTAGYEAHGYRMGLAQTGLLLALFTVGALRARPWAALAAGITYAELLYDHFHSWSGSHTWVYLGTALLVAAGVIIADGARRLTESRALLAAYKEQVQRKHRDREQRAVLLERI